MKGYAQDIGSIAARNTDLRRVLYTAENCHLVVMALQPQEEIGAEVHKLERFFRVEQGRGEVTVDGVQTPIRAGSVVLVPAGGRHNITNTGSSPLKFYTVYAPPSHGGPSADPTLADA